MHSTTPERRAPDLADRALDHREARVAVVLLLQGLDGGADIVDRAVELLLRVGKALADLPHDQAHDLLPPRLHLPGEVLHAGDALRHLHGGPLAPAIVVGRHGRRQRRIGLRLVGLGMAAELDLPQLPIGIADADRREHGVDLARPGAELAVEEVAALMDRPQEPVLGRDLLLQREECPQLGRVHHGRLPAAVIPDATP